MGAWHAAGAREGPRRDGGQALARVVRRARRRRASRGLVRAVVRVPVTCGNATAGQAGTGDMTGVQMRVRRVGGAIAALALLISLAGGSAANARTPAKVIRLGEYKLSAGKLDALRTDWIDQLLARHARNGWAPMRFNLTDRDLRLMGLPSRRVLTAHRY